MNRTVMQYFLSSALAGVLLMAGHPGADAMMLQSCSRSSGAEAVLESGHQSGAQAGKTWRVSTAEELSALRKTLRPGDTVIWKDGTYHNINIKFSGAGAENAPITLKAETPGGVVFTGLSSMSLNGAWLAAEGFRWDELDTSEKKSLMTFSKTSSWCRYSDCMIDGTGSKVSDVDSKWVSLYGDHNTVEHCTFIDKRNMGCLMVVWFEDGKVPAHVIADNYFTRPYTHYDSEGKARNGQESLRIGTSDYSMQDGNCTVTGNWFYRCNGERAEIISNKSCGNAYEGNLFEESDGTLTLRHGNRCLVKGNYFLSGRKPDVGGVRIIGEDHVVEDNIVVGATGTGYKSGICLVRGESDAALNGYWTVKNAVVRNNFLIDCRCGITVNFSGRKTQDSHPENTLFEGNTIVSHKKYMMPVYVVDTPDDEMTWKDNVIYGGKCNGIELEETDVEPQLPDYETVPARIRESAGVRWSL